MVAGLSGLVICLQSNLIGPNLCRLFSNLGVCGLFSFPLIGSLFLARCMLIGWLQVTWWGRGIPPFQGKPKPRSRPPASPGSPTFPPVFVSMEGPIMGLLYHLWGQSNIEIWVTLGGQTGSVFFLTTPPWETSHSRCFLGFGVEVSFFCNLFLLCLGVGVPSRTEVSLYLT